MNHDLAELRSPNHAECPDHAADCNAARAFVIDMLCEDAITPAALEALGFTFEYALYFRSFGECEVQVVKNEDKPMKVYLYEGGDCIATPVTTIGQLRALIFALSPKGPADE